MRQQKFKVGDIVDWLGLEGVIKKIEWGNLHIDFGDKYSFCFLSNGKFLPEQTEPSIRLIVRPKQKVKKYKVLFKNPFGEWQLTSSYYETIKDFDCNNIYEDKHTLPQTQIEVEE